MKAKALVPGRADQLVEAMIERGLKLHGDPIVRIAARLAKPHIAQALTETVGPETTVGKWAKYLVEAAGQFEQSFMEAQRQIEAEDRGE